MTTRVAVRAHIGLVRDPGRALALAVAVAVEMDATENMQQKTMNSKRQMRDEEEMN